ncbi:hypothetical protein BaRGS_00005504 [Batillaria attramentaria]|uniref:Uncharacterized protein n=1 Tax=Batillaria attramentaria TaxID=370345 RepID=A0ABD0LUG0_9CAEN
MTPAVVKVSWFLLSARGWLTVLLCCSLLLSASTAENSAGVSQCDEGWHQFEDSCYYFSNNSASWNESRKACQGMGADLVIISSEEVQNFTLQWLKARTWIGLWQEQPDTTWTWVDGSQVSYRHWMTGEPNNLTNEDCAEMIIPEGFWNDIPCSERKLSICQKAAERIVTTSVETFPATTVTGKDTEKVVFERNVRKANETLDTIQQELKHPEALKNQTVLDSVVKNVDEILKNDVDVLKEGSLAEGLLSVITDVSQHMPLTNGSQVIRTPSVVLAAMAVDTESFTGLTLTAGTLNTTSLTKGHMEVDQTDSLELPSSLLASAQNCATDRITMAVHASAKIFEALQDAADNVTAKVNSVVMAASVVNCTVKDLADPVRMTFVPKEKDWKGEGAGCAFWDEALRDWSTEGCELVVESSTTGMASCRCNHLSSFAFVMTTPSKILLNLCAALALSNLVFLVGMQEYAFNNHVACKAVSVLLHYSLLASLCWMLVEGFYMYLALVRVYRSQIPNFVLISSSVGWGAPLATVVITLAVNETENYAKLDSGICWLKGTAFYAAFMAPVGLILLLNFIAFILVVKTILGQGQQLSQAQSKTSAQRLRGATGVFILLGLTWVFGFLSIDKASLVFSYLFAIFNTLQGLFIFLFYAVLRKESRDAWRQLCCRSEDEAVSRGTTSTNDVTKGVTSANDMTKGATSTDDLTKGATSCNGSTQGLRGHTMARCCSDSSGNGQPYEVAGSEETSSYFDFSKTIPM